MRRVVVGRVRGSFANPNLRRPLKSLGFRVSGRGPRPETETLSPKP